MIRRVIMFICIIGIFLIFIFLATPKLNDEVALDDNSYHYSCYLLDDIQFNDFKYFKIGNTSYRKYNPYYESSVTLFDYVRVNRNYLFDIGELDGEILEYDKNMNMINIIKFSNSYEYNKGNDVFYISLNLSKNDKDYNYFVDYINGNNIYVR